MTMTDQSMFAVFLHEQAVEALGGAIVPYLVDSPAGKHLMCAEIDSGGALFEMLLIGRNERGEAVEVELMLPVGMVKLVISVRREGEFGFGPRSAKAAATAPGPAPASMAPGAAST
jgi:hypothetical protein